MTCVLSPWQPFSQSYGWSPMDPAPPTSIPSDFGKQQHGYTASESESTQASNSSGKKRTSRAGTRSVSSLSAAQLERKRANDRDAQRAIRQRTKDHIDSLEKTISDLRMTQEATEKLLAATQQQNQEIVEENAYLRSKLKEAGMTVSGAASDNLNRNEVAQFPTQSKALARQASDMSTHTNDASSTSHRALSLATTQSSDSQLSSWQQTQSSTIQSAPTNLQTATPMQRGPSLTNWRSHDKTQSIAPSSEQTHVLSPEQSHAFHGSPIDHTGAQWTVLPQPQIYHDQQLSQQYGSTPQQQEYAHTAVPTYTPHVAPHQSNYQTPAAPQAEFQGMTVASPVVYQMPQQQHPAFSQQTQYSLSSGGQSATELPAQPTQMHNPQPLGLTYTSTVGSPHYSQHVHQPLPFRDSTGAQSYPPTQYPSR